MIEDLTPGEVAHLERVTRNTVYRWITDGTLVARRTPGGRGWRISAAELSDKRGAPVTTAEIAVVRSEPRFGHVSAEGE